MMNPTGNNGNRLRGLGLLLVITILVIGAASAWAAPPAGLPEGYPTTERQKLSFNADWKFQLGGSSFNKTWKIALAKGMMGDPARLKKINAKS